MNKPTTLLASLFVISMIQACSKPSGSNESPATCDVIITGVVDGRKIIAIKAVREVTGLGLKDAKDLVEKTPSVVKHSLSKPDADIIAARLKEVGLIVEIKQK